MVKTMRLAREIREYAEIKKRCAEKYSEFMSAADSGKRSAVNDPSLFYLCPPDASGKVRAIFFPKVMYDWMLDSSEEFKSKCSRENDPTYKVFMEIYSMKRGHMA